MKTMIDIPDDVFRQAKAAAAMRGESLKDFVICSIRDRLAPDRPGKVPVSGWKTAFGKVRPDEVAEVDAIVAEELGTVHAELWR